MANKKTIKPLVTPWIAAIRNHFWYAVANCDEDELRMRVIWLRVLQHICEDHSQCDHAPMEEPSEGLYNAYLMVCTCDVSAHLFSIFYEIVPFIESLHT